MSAVQEQVATTTTATITEPAVETPVVKDVQDATTPAEVEQVLEKDGEDVVAEGEGQDKDEEVKQTQENVEKPVEEQAKEEAEQPVKEQEQGNLKNKLNNMFKKYLKKFKTVF